MNVVHSCRCCLRRAPYKDLTKPYTHLGNTEIYSDMLKECFEIHVMLGDSVECGICEVCVGRLRDASHFKLQVQRSQAELQRLQDDKLAVIIEVGDDGASEQYMFASYEEPVEESAMVHENNTGLEVSSEDPLVKMETADGDVAGEEELSSGPVTPGGAGANTSDARSGVESSSDTDEQEDKQPSFQCKVCDKTFVNNSVLRRHEVLHTAMKPYRCDQCNKQFSRQGALHDHRKLHVREKSYECDVCNKRFKVKSALNAHVKCHSGNKPYSCSACEKQFVRKARFDTHERTYTEGGGPHICVKCHMKFTKKCALIRHQNIIHAADLLMYAICNKEFKSKKYLKGHKKIHTGEKSYRCEVCNKRFLRKHGLQVHRGTHAGEKTFPCEVCKKQFSEWCLRRHKKIHAKKYKCEECNKLFRDKNCLFKHKWMHTGEKPFSCKDCNKQFTRKNALNRHALIHLEKKGYSNELYTKKFTQKAKLIMHERIHTGEKPFECDMCQAKFACKDSLIRHIAHKFITIS